MQCQFVCICVPRDLIHPGNLTLTRTETNQTTATTMDDCTVQRDSIRTPHTNSHMYINDTYTQTHTCAYLYKSNSHGVVLLNFIVVAQPHTTHIQRRYPCHRSCLLKYREVLNKKKVLGSDRGEWILEFHTFSHCTQPRCAAVPMSHWHLDGCLSLLSSLSSFCTASLSSLFQWTTSRIKIKFAFTMNLRILLLRKSAYSL